MERYHWQKIEKILDKALTFDTLAEQELYIREACKDNQSLFLEIRLLIRSIHDAERIHYLEEEE
ncbi:hypothetical protein SAMN05443144_104138 [Fodinibius roseus]|uniref:Uncharacterized protein n=1 Tax=Fodinibius roseus TaxID=1194090 RepID=A0A1M4XIA6_9BACT|nr:hypothetical protein [Fodinibius roseus]SHE93407.1 hypothetical protein SAMN05443144_104138 [Fodinibius roseus]